MKSIKLRYTTQIVEKTRNHRFFKSENSILNLVFENRKIRLFANINQEFLDLHCLNTNRVLIPIIKSFKYYNAKIYVFEVAMFSKNKTAEIKKSLIDLIDELSKSFKILKNDKQNINKLVIMFTNLSATDEIDLYLKEDQRIAS